MTTEIVDANAQARADGLDAALAVLALLAVVSLMFTGRIPDHQPAGDDSETASEAGAAT